MNKGNAAPGIISDSRTTQAVNNENRSSAGATASMSPHDVFIENCETAIDNNDQQRFADLGCTQPQLPDPGPSSRDTLSAVFTGVVQGLNQAAATRNPNRGKPSDQTYTPPTLPAYNSPTSAASYGGQDGIVDNAILQCIKLSHDDEVIGYYFHNNCNIKAKVIYVCRDASNNQSEAMAEADIEPQSRSPAPCFLPRNNTDFAACPYEDGVYGPDGSSSWRGYTGFLCKRYN